MDTNVIILDVPGTTEYNQEITAEATLEFGGYMFLHFNFRHVKEL
jgi:hypothetical protein